MNTYPSYKDSGVEWIGEIPSEWGYSKLRYLLRRKVSDGPHETPTFTDTGIPFLSVDGIQNGELVLEGCRYISQEDHNRYKKKCPIEKDDVLVGKSASIGKIARVKVDFPISVWSPLAILKTDLQVLKPSFLEYSLSSIFLQDQIEILSTSNTQKNISMGDIQRLQIVYPPLQEQQQISYYLDYKTSKIDTLIEKTQQKIDLLKEQRTSLINTTVTKGMNPNVEMKDSGVEWIGEIPSEWSVISLRHYLSRVGSGSTPRGGGDVYFDSGIPFLRSQNIHFDGLHLDDVVFISEEIHLNMSNTTVRYGDVLLNITGGSIGRSCVVDIHEEMNVNQHVSILRTKENLINFYLNYCLISSIGQEQVSYNQTGGNREGLTSENIKNFKFSLPPLQEQQQIVDYLDKETSKIDKLIDIETKRIDLLKEYRQSLISDVVTGKVDVRDEVLV